MQTSVDIWQLGACPGTPLRSTLLPLSNIIRQPVTLRSKCNLGPLGEQEVIPRRSLVGLATGVGNREITFQDDLELVVGVGVLQRGALFQAEEARGDGGLGVGVFGGENVFKVGVFVGEEGGFELLGEGLEQGELDWGFGHFGGGPEGVDCLRLDEYAW